MSRRISAIDVIGGLALAAMLALTSPGVRVAHAEGAPAPTAAAADPGVCRVDEPAAPRVSRDELGARIAARLQQEMAASDGEVVVLNGRGYNYRRDRNPLGELEWIEREAQRQATRP